MRSFIDFVACLFKIFLDDESKKKRAIYLSNDKENRAALQAIFSLL